MLQHAICILTVFSLGANWPTYQGNLARTGVSKETITPTLQEDWRHESAPPRPAWPDPARQDFWHSKYGLAPSVTFDRVHQVVAANGRVYFGSTVNDAITCLDAATGKSIWTFCSEGPVRLAPSVVDNHVYFGSDDGYAYCVSGADGALVWKRRIADKDRRIGGNGRMISAWPLRCGVLVDNGTVYCTAGIFPTYGVWLAALDAGSGEVNWRRRLETIAPQGYMLASPTRLYVPTGRTSPAVFDRKDGKPVDLSGIGRRGGTFALIVDEGLVHRGDGEDQIELQSGAGDRMALFAGRQAIVDGETAYLLDNNKLSALNRARYIRLAHERQKLTDAEKADERTDETKRKLAENAKAMGACWLWREESEQQGVMLLAQDTIIVGGQDEIAIRDTADGSLLATLSINGAAHGLSVADGRLLVSTDRGVVHCFAEGEKVDVPSDSEVAAPTAQATVARTASPTCSVAAGPHVRHLAPDQVEISWQSDDSRPMGVQIAELGGDTRTLSATRAQQNARHVAVAAGLTPQAEYSFRVTAGDPSGIIDRTPRFTFDASCDVPPRPLPHTEAEAETSDLVRRALGAYESSTGYALLLGDNDSLATEIARQSQMQVIVAEPDQAKADAARVRLARTGIYGTRAVVHCVPLDRLPYASHSINLVIVDPGRCGDRWKEHAAEAGRVCRRCGGAVCGFDVEAMLEGDYGIQHLGLNGKGLVGIDWLMVFAGPLEERGQWSHLYSDPSGKASSDEALRAPLQLQWFGRPGPKHMIDRHHRGMSPLVVDGRIFLPGNERLKGVDAFNGSILWDLTLPGFRRVAMMRDSGHLAAQKDEVFAVVRDGCRVIDAATGRWLRTLPLPESKNGAHEYWGYLAVIDDAVLGTTEAAGASFDQHVRDIPARISFWDDVPVVVGKTLFSLDRESGNPRWIYKNAEGSVLLHSTVVAADDGIYFIESRAPEAVAAEDGRVTLEVACAPGAVRLVALDLASGEKLWERPVELHQIRNVLHAVCAENAIILAGTHNEQRHPRYDLLAFNTSDGSPRWATHYLRTDKPMNGDHGEQDQHPVVVGKTLYSRPYAFDVHTGEKLDFQLDRGGHGCGGLSGSACHLFGRGRNPRMYELDAGPQSGTPVTQVTRPGCWINMIAADGLLLIPEGSSGCSCAFSIQTSLGLAPVGSPRDDAE